MDLLKECYFLLDWILKDKEELYNSSFDLSIQLLKKS
jgi:hypothetical protein